MGEDLGKRAWFLEKEGKGRHGDVWERGVPGTSLARKRTPQGTVNTQDAIDKALQSLPEYERQPADDQKNAAEKKPGFKGRVSTESSSWRNPVTQPVRVDQDMPVTRRKVVGAYADVVNDESLHITVGPELSIDTEYAGGKHAGHQQAEPNTLGVGMQFQWDF